MKRRYPVLRILAAIFVISAAMVAAFYGIENWRGARAWETARRELAAQGESLDPEKFIPPPLPDDQNLALIPLFAATLDYRIDPKTGQLTFGTLKTEETLFGAIPYGPRSAVPPGKIATWTSGHALPLDRLQQYYAKQPDFPQATQPGAASADVLQALTKFAPLLDEVSEAIGPRPRARFPVDWNHQPPMAIRLPHYILFQKLATVLRLRSVAYLAAGQHEEAARDLTLYFRLRAAIQPETPLIRHLVTVTCDNLMLQTVWEGLKDRRWTADELRGIQEFLRSEDLLSDYVQAIRCERAVFFCPTLDGLKTADGARQLLDLTGIDDEKQKGANFLAALFPRGWIDQNKAGVCLGYQRIITDAVDLKTHRVFPERLKAISDERAVKGAAFSPTMFLTKIVLPVCESVLSKTARMQAARDQGEIACALERYFLEHQAYPEKLDALIPIFLDRLPDDLADGAPMRYQRTTEGRYRLWSIGWNGRDDGGVIAWPSISSEDARPDDKQGDWVWQYLAAEPPANAR